MSRKAEPGERQRRLQAGIVVDHLLAWRQGLHCARRFHLDRPRQARDADLRPGIAQVEARLPRARGARPSVDDHRRAAAGGFDLGFARHQFNSLVAGLRATLIDARLRVHLHMQLVRQRQLALLRRAGTEVRREIQQ
ncbi:hypothetical protein G6F50_016518 [Rhizopus delemar]|uniref:Uncharacterized protein n=1 Tax=Rhizopus delemar TaxID=936053 RepID=A0A9P6XTC9_9FUNG|nr:hypothetical protein G6F50_016518 [Rhizopus delemar]